MAKKFTGGSFISDRSGFRFDGKSAVVEPGTGYLVSKNESDGEYNLVDHPCNHPNKYVKYGDPYPVKNARPEQSFPDAQNRWLGNGYSYIHVSGSIAQDSLIVTRYGSGTSTITITTENSTTIQTPEVGSGTSNVVVTTTANGVGSYLASGSSNVAVTANNSVTSVSTTAGLSYSTAFSSAFAVFGSPVSYLASGSSNVAVTGVCSQSVKGGATASGSSNVAVTTNCSGTYVTSGATGSYSSAFSYAFDR